MIVGIDLLVRRNCMKTGEHPSSEFHPQPHFHHISSLPITVSNAFRLTATLCSSALNFAIAAKRLGSWLSTRSFSFTRTSCPLYVKMSLASSCEVTLGAPNATARRSLILKPVIDSAGGMLTDSKVRIWRSRAASEIES